MAIRRKRFAISGILILFLLMITISAEGTYQKNTNLLTSSLSTNNPLLASSFLGGSNKDGTYYTGVNIIQDHQGDVFIAGTTQSSDFPVTTNAYSTSYHGNRDVFVTKMNSDLTTVLASTFIGGSNNEEARGIVIDSNGDIFICGITQSSDFPSTANAFQQIYHDGTQSPYGSGDAFIVKLTNDLTEVLSSTFLGGQGHEYCNAIDIDSKGDIVITGGTSSIDFPMTELAFDKTYQSGGNLGDDIYIAKLSNDLSTLLASTYLGGNQDDITEGIIVDNYDSIYVTGWICSPDFPTTENTYDKTFGGGYYDGFIARFSNNLATLESSTFLGGTQWDFCYGITIDADDNIYVTGHTASTNYPTTPTAFCKSYQGSGGPDIGDDVFISKFNCNLTTLSASTFLGGDNWEIGYTIRTSQQNRIYVAGTTSSIDFPTTPNAFSSLYHGGTKYTGDIFLCYFNNELSLLHASTYLGDNGIESTGQLIIDNSDNVFIGGSTSSEKFPISNGCYDTTYNGVDDVFLSKFDWSLSYNKPPEKPVTPDGSTSGKTGVEYNYNTSTTDPDADQVYYFFDWNDGTSSGWIGPYNSGDKCQSNHTWTTKGTYNIKVKAKDAFGTESDWSDSLPISMPYSYNPMLRFLELLFQRFPNAFPLLRQILG